MTELLFKSQVAKALDIDPRAVAREGADLAVGTIKFPGRQFLLFGKSAIDELKRRREEKSGQ